MNIITWTDNPYPRSALLCVVAIGSFAASASRPACATPAAMSHISVKAKLPSDPSYWAGGPYAADEPTSAPPLDLFGSPTDFENASTSVGPAAANAAAVANGILTVNLTHSGLNIVDISIPADTPLSGIAAITADNASPTGLVLNVQGNALVFKRHTFNLGGLGIGQALLNLGAGDIVPLKALALDMSVLAPLSGVTFYKNGIDSALVTDTKANARQPDEAAFATPLSVYFITGAGRMAATARSRAP